MSGSRRRRGLDHGGLADSEGSTGPAPGRAGPTRVCGWGSKSGELDEEQAQSSCKCFSSLEFLLPLQPSRVAIRVLARSLYFVASVGRPYSG